MRSLSLAILLLGLSRPPREAAEELFAGLPAPTQQEITRLAGALDLERRPRIQIELLKDDIRWQDKGLTEHQLEIVGATVLLKAMERAEAVLAEKPEAGGSKLDRYKAKKRRARIRVFLLTAGVELEKCVKRLGKVRDYELGFRL